jgi:hypothetical protein
VPRERKPVERRQRRNTKDLEPRPGPAVAVLPSRSSPTPGSGWLTATRAEWAQLWSTAVGDYLLDSDVGALRRCFAWRDELRRLRTKARRVREVAEAEPLTRGSTGQAVANPLFAVADRLDDRALSIETRIVALEDRLALSPKARLNLGVTEQKGANLAAQNAAIAAAVRTHPLDREDA